MQLTLLESDRSFLRSAECAALSIVAHLGIVWASMAATGGGFHPSRHRAGRPPHVPAPARPDPRRRAQAELPRLGKLGSGSRRPAAAGPGEGMRIQAAAPHARRKGARSGTRKDLPVAPTPFVPDSVYSALQVDQMVERFESSAAPVYPPELIQRGVEGQVDATYVVDTRRAVDTATFQVLAERRFTVHRIGPDGPGRHAVPAGQAVGKGGPSARGPAVPLQDRPDDATGRERSELTGSSPAARLRPAP